jgi:hypothetical protein
MPRKALGDARACEGYVCIEILGLEGESTNEKWTIFLGYQGKFIICVTISCQTRPFATKFFSIV